MRLGSIETSNKKINSLSHPCENMSNHTKGRTGVYLPRLRRRWTQLVGKATEKLAEELARRAGITPNKKKKRKKTALDSASS